ncbi:MAG TPA: hypothetical protein VFF39_01245 [Verrucomicrobiae bacterium]|jgi:hypothetical protein|nr:hypothetical protein [Verrucomicrobiae bacterium]
MVEIKGFKTRMAHFADREGWKWESSSKVQKKSLAIFYRQGK